MKHNVEVIEIPIKDITRLDTANPNVMSQARLTALEEVIDSQGFVQPILCQRKGKKFVLIDGHHRIAAMVSLGHDSILSVIAKDGAHAKLLRISLNKIRGDLDYTLVAEELSGILEEGDLEREDLKLSGFSEGELAGLLDMFAQPDEDSHLKGSDTSFDNPDDKSKSHSLSLKFESETQRAQVREKLLECGATVEEGVMKLLGLL